MTSMSDKEIETLINLLRWLENRGSIIIVENNIAEIHKEIRSFNPNDNVCSTYQSLNPDLILPSTTTVEIPTESENPAGISPAKPIPGKATLRKTVTTLKKRRGRKRITNAGKTAKRKRKEKQEKEELALALAEATRGTYIGQPPKPKPLNTLLLLRRRHRPLLKCTVTDVPPIPVKPPEPPKSPELPLAETIPKKPTPTPKEYKCDQCDKTLKTKASLKFHLIFHSNLQEVICERCGKTFNHRRGLKRHLLVHEGTRKYACDVCPATFLFQQKLKQHKMMHDGCFNFCCGVCNRGFVTKKHLQTHEVVHSEKRPFVCSVCQKSFRRISHLHQHSRIHSGIRPFKCLPCGKEFVQQASLQCHNKTHHKGEASEQTLPGGNDMEIVQEIIIHEPGIEIEIINDAELTTLEIPTQTLSIPPANTISIPGTESHNWKPHLALGKKSVVIPIPISECDQHQVFTWKPHLAKKSEVLTTSVTLELPVGEEGTTTEWRSQETFIPVVTTTPTLFHQFP